MTKFLQALLLLCAVTSFASGFKILGLFPFPTVSHFQFFHPIMRGLAENGHEVTVVSYFPDKNPPANYKDLVLESSNLLMSSMDLEIMTKKKSFYSHLHEFFMLLGFDHQHCKDFLNSKALDKVINGKEKYDLIITENFNSDCTMGAVHVLKAPVIALSSCAILPWFYDRYSLPFNPSYNPNIFMNQNEQMDFMGRLGNWITHHTFKALYSYYNIRQENALVREKFGADVPSVDEIGKEASLIFVNQHFSLSGARALSPQVIEIGGIHINEAKPLDPKFKNFLDSAENGVVYISWGSMIRADTLPTEKKEGILRAIRKLKQKVIWKFENETLPNMPDNLLVSKWLPQRDILCHPNVKAFMTHGGLMGATESVYCGVPMVSTPIYGDQFLNAQAIANREMGVVLNFEDIDENTVLNSLNTVLTQKYQNNAKSVSYSFKHRPKEALETALWWVEYVAQTKGGHLLKSPAPNMSAFSFYCVDIYLFFAVIAFVLLFLVKLVLSKLFVKSKTSKKAKRH